MTTFEKAVADLKNEIIYEGGSIMQWAENKSIYTLAARVRKGDRYYIIRTNECCKWNYREENGFNLYEDTGNLELCIIYIFKDISILDNYEMLGEYMSPREIGILIGKNL